MKLVVDVGNSRIKWARIDGGRLGPGRRAERCGSLEKLLDQLWHVDEAPSTVMISSVAGADADAAIERWITNRWGFRPDWFRSRSETLGLINGYRDSEQLGSDRWAALVGARGLLPGPFGVIDCGTAVTLDVIDERDRHLGGLIGPGLELAQLSLLAGTASIGEAGNQAVGLLGRNTADCVANGTTLGLAGALERWMAEVEESVNGVSWLATGGAWPRLSSRIRKTVRYDPDLVLKGLARVLE
ncbi:MAG: type III pantothenate kinase [Arenicellales bacterium]